jgi:uncharacterized protein (DUF169 family)
LDILERFKDAVDEQLALRSSPIAIKLLKLGEEVPPKMGRPLRDLGVTIRPCEGWHFASHKRLSVTMLLEDFSTACPTGIFAFGLAEPIQPWFEGFLSNGFYAVSKEAAANMERQVFRLGAGKYRGVAFSPIEKADFTADLVMLYCNSKEAMRLVNASVWITGDPLKVSVAARNVCADAIVQPFQTGQPVLAIPCGGDRSHAGTDDNEIVFTAPVDKLEGVIEGLYKQGRANVVKKLGGQTKVGKQYSKMAKIMDKELGRGTS